MTIFEAQSIEPRREQADRTYLRIGKVVSHAALMEQWLFYLATTLDRTQAQQDVAGAFGRDLVKHCRRHVNAVPEPVRGEVKRLLEDIEQAQERRNVVVHSVLASPGDPRAYAHRPLPKKQRVASHEWIGEAYLTEEHLDELDAEISEILERLIRVRPLAERP
ncbi:hypothetical protein SAMN05892883_2207 [Jatrophihabitans sp. GAS493]|uniref:hypothetical protein n=1 Tax=Jatrophihabitans sp. GAS493 TaxID=1907575 RepID=UPI000BB949F6|nr:hypothetical protein [Jatrophihabitans sp. GAS493]SOD72891.1 hypothetical protein SAMN05892883_2207 [Jatrophihabitans sp. GAS493]